MPAKWNPPLVETDLNYAELIEGELYQGVRVTFCAEDIEMFRQGYKCLGLNCWEPQPTAFPEKCFLCGFPIRDEQMRVFEQLFAGVRDDLGPSFDVDEELDHLERQRHERERREGVRSRIWLPDHN